MNRLIQVVENSEDDECCVCFNSTKNMLKPCNHKACVKCMERWYEIKKEPICPMCRTTLCSFTLNKDFEYNMKIFANDAQHFGITVFFSGKKDAVVVKKCKIQDRAYECGLRKGHVITHANGIKLKSHSSLIKIMEQCRKHNLEVYLQTYKQKKTILSLFISNLKF